MARRHQSGFTLAEVVIAFAIVSIALVPISAAIVHGHNISSQAAQLTQAAFLARHLVEEVLASRTASLCAGTAMTQAEPWPFPGHERFKYTRFLQEAVYDMLRVEVCIFWHTHGQEHQYLVVALID